MGDGGGCLACVRAEIWGPWEVPFESFISRKILLYNGAITASAFLQKPRMQLGSAGMPSSLVRFMFVSLARKGYLCAQHGGNSVHP